MAQAMVNFRMDEDLKKTWTDLEKLPLTWIQVLEQFMISWRSDLYD